MGIERSKEAFGSADLIILVLDGSEEISDEDYEIIEYIKRKKLTYTCKQV